MARAEKNKVRLVCTECYKKLEGEAFMVPVVKPKKTKADYSEAMKLIFQYKKLFKQQISPEEPILNMGLCLNMAKKQIDLLGYDRVRQLLDAFLASDDKFYKENAYSISLFLADSIINRLNVFTQR